MMHIRAYFFDSIEMSELKSLILHKRAWVWKEKYYTNKQSIYAHVSGSIGGHVFGLKNKPFHPRP